MYSKILIALCLVQVALAGFGGPAGAPSFAGVKAIGIFNKQMGMSQGILKKTILAAKNEIKLQLDALKATVALLPPTDECATIANAQIAEIDNDLLTAFDKCDMTADLQAVRLQALTLKQQFAAHKMAVKACKTSVDPVTCLADANEGAGDDVAAATGDVATGITDVIAKANDCVLQEKTQLLERITNVSEELALCEL